MVYCFLKIVFFVLYIWCEDIISWLVEDGKCILCSCCILKIRYYGGNKSLLECDGNSVFLLYFIILNDIYLIYFFRIIREYNFFLWKIKFNMDVE